MSESPKISVIVPTYNNERYLSQCLDSARSQTLADFEVICVNDGSSDDSLEIMHRYRDADKRFKIIDKLNSGYGHSMNCGLETAKGTYIAILESDDRILPTMFEELFALAEKYNLDFVKADFQTFYGDGDSLRTEYKEICTDKSLYNVVIDPRENLAVFDIDMVTWTGIYRRDFLEKNCIRYNETPGAAYQDNGFWFQTFAYATRTMFVPKPFYLYRQDNPNSSINSKTKVFCMCEEHVYMHNFLEQHPELDARLYRMWSKKMFHNYNFTYDRIAPEYREQFLERFASDFITAFERGELSKEDFFEDEWSKLNDIMDDPHLAHLKFEDIILDERSEAVERYQLRRQQAVIDTLVSQLEDYRTSCAYSIAAKVKKVGDYRREFGTGQLLKRAILKSHASSQQRIEHAQSISNVELGPLPESYLAFADAYTNLDTPEAVSCWYRRKIGVKINLGQPQNAEDLVQVVKLRNAQAYRECIGSLTRVYGYAEGLIGSELLPRNLVVFDSLEQLENYLFEQRPQQYKVKINGKTSWSLLVQDASSLDFEALRYHYKRLKDSNLPFCAGEILSDKTESAKILLHDLIGNPNDIVRITVCCSRGDILGSIKETPWRDGAQTTTLGESGLSEELLLSAKALSAELPFISVVFDEAPNAIELVSIEAGVHEGTVGALDDGLKNRIHEALKHIKE